MIKIIYYLVLETITNPVIRSQSISIATFLHSQLDIEVIYYGLSKNYDTELSLETEEIKNLMVNQGIDVNLYPNTRHKGILSTLHVLKRIYNDFKKQLQNKPGTILARGLFAGTLAYLVAKRSVNIDYVIDLRSHYGAELEMSGWMQPNSFRAKVFYQWEKFILQKSTSVLCVSYALANYVNQVTGNAVPCYVVPSCLDEALKYEVNQTLLNMEQLHNTIQNNLTIAYIGTLTHWNRVDIMALFLKRVWKLVPNMKFLCITTNVESAVSTLGEFGVYDKYEVINVPHRDVISVLRQADVGLLLRDSSMVNRVASPVKFAEYLAAGLAVIATESLGDVSTTIQENEIGYVLSSLNPDTWNNAEISDFMQRLLYDRMAYRRRSVQVASKHFFRTTYKVEYLRALSFDMDR